ncbi:hypothetical protein BDV97DRAFT_110841 [Delphinella strobiligena]|nr:hypothetical protein BDV97DRAFT_110841 [Delphinella strobiligena]
MWSRWQGHGACTRSSGETVLCVSCGAESAYYTDEEERRWSGGDDPRGPESTTQQSSAAATTAAGDNSTSQCQSRTSSSLNREAATEGAPSNVSVHGRTQSLTDGRPRSFVCSICSKSLSSAYSLKRHINDVHAGGKPSKCAGCGEILSAANVGDHQCNDAAGEPADHDDNGLSKGPSSGPKKR